jgi:hypothetical protein
MSTNTEEVRKLVSNSNIKWEQNCAGGNSVTQSYIEEQY